MLNWQRCSADDRCLQRPLVSRRQRGSQGYIYRYIADSLKEGNTAAKQTNRIRKGIRSLDVMPERHRAVEWEPWTSLGMRRMLVDNYVIYNLVDKESRTVTIVRVFCGGRNVEETVKGG